MVGGTSGIGAAVVSLLDKDIRHDTEVIIPSREVMDVRNIGQVNDFVRAHGPFGHIVYSAGVNTLAWARDLTVNAIMRETFDINVTGLVTLISEHLRSWPESEMNIVAVSSDAGRIPMRGSVAYCSSKAALNMAVRVLARELAPEHRINAVAPGMVEGTPMTEYIDRTIPGFRGWSLEFAREYERMGTPTGVRATLEEVAQTIVWLLFGPEQMTGAIVDINGGR